MEKYNHKKIEKKWQKEWEKLGIYKAKDGAKKPKQYILFEFPFPSGQGLHTGHCRGYTAMDVVARKKRMTGNNVLFPIGWDAFGLPAENFAIKYKTHPQKTTEENIANFKKQFEALGISLDWDREINTTDPGYYKWTQWIFFKLFEKGLAYQAEMPINWCPSCKIGLANEEVVAGKCERCGAVVEKRKLKQWMLKITEYADRLIDDLDKVDYPERVKTQQINWIGRKEGNEVAFKLKTTSQNSKLKIFTTRLDTIFGCTYLVVAPEHPIINNQLSIKDNDKLSMIDNSDEVREYVEKSAKKSDLQRAEIEKEKTGIELKGIKAINPFNKQEIPIFIADYVLPNYGTGAIMAVPAHDERDYDFAKKYDLEIKKVVSGNNLPFTQDGILINSGKFNGLTSEQARKKMIDFAKRQKFGKQTINYKLRDWVFSRQHYWGEPIPLIHCEKCGIVAVPEKDLPVELPYVEKYEPTGTGESPLADVADWVNCKCPKCGNMAKRETDTMPNWAGSSWYYLRYIDPHNNKILADPKKLKYWLPVDWYNGGMEHTTLHLLYSRFWHKFLFDIGVVPNDEPYQKRTSHGIVLAEDGRKMSKSFGNVVNPDDIIEKFGADSLRIYEMFMGPFEQSIAWNSQGVVGARRFLQKVWKLSGVIASEPSRPPHLCIGAGAGRVKQSRNDEELERLIHQIIKKVSDDIENLKFNTAISSLMVLVNEMEKQGQLSRVHPVKYRKAVISPEAKLFNRVNYQALLKLLSPFAPHICEELWSKLGYKSSIFQEKWPEYNSKLIQQDQITLVVQINGKVRDSIECEADISEAEAKKLTLQREKVKKYIGGKTIKKVIFVKGKLINIVC